jgi:hypothetical protein
MITYIAKIEYHDLRHIDPEPHPIGELMEGDTTKLMNKVGGVIRIAESRNLLKDNIMTIAISREDIED